MTDVTFKLSTEYVDGPASVAKALTLASPGGNVPADNCELLK